MSPPQLLLQEGAHLRCPLTRLLASGRLREASLSLLQLRERQMWSLVPIPVRTGAAAILDQQDEDLVSTATTSSTQLIPKCLGSNTHQRMKCIYFL